jgi:hypothetical protein
LTLWMVCEHTAHLSVFLPALACSHAPARRKKLVLLIAWICLKFLAMHAGPPTEQDRMQDQRMHDLLTAVELGRRHPEWFKKNMQAFAAVREEFIPDEKDRAAWDLSASVSNDELAAWSADEREMDSIMGHIGAAWRMTVEHPWTLEVFEPSAEMTLLVQQSLLPGESLACVVQLEAALKMANAYCFRVDKSESIENWLLMSEQSIENWLLMPEQ